MTVPLGARLGEEEEERRVRRGLGHHAKGARSLIPIRCCQETSAQTGRALIWRQAVIFLCNLPIFMCWPVNQTLAHSAKFSQQVSSLQTALRTSKAIRELSKWSRSRGLKEEVGLGISLQDRQGGNELFIF